MSCSGARRLGIDLRPRADLVWDNLDGETRPLSPPIWRRDYRKPSSVHCEAVISAHIDDGLDLTRSESDA